MSNTQCRAGESVYEACARGFGAGYTVIVRGMGSPNPTAPGQVGTITVRRGERFAVVPRAEVES